MDQCPSQPARRQPTPLDLHSLPTIPSRFQPVALPSNPDRFPSLTDRDTLSKASTIHQVNGRPRPTSTLNAKPARPRTSLGFLSSLRSSKGTPPTPTIPQKQPPATFALGSASRSKSIERKPGLTEKGSISSTRTARNDCGTISRPTLSSNTSPISLAARGRVASETQSIDSCPPPFAYAATTPVFSNDSRLQTPRVLQDDEFAGQNAGRKLGWITSKLKKSMRNNQSNSSFSPSTHSADSMSGASSSPKLSEEKYRSSTTMYRRTSLVLGSSSPLSDKVAKAQRDTLPEKKAAWATMFGSLAKLGDAYPISSQSALHEQPRNWEDYLTLYQLGAIQLSDPPPLPLGASHASRSSPAAEPRSSQTQINSSMLSLLDESALAGGARGAEAAIKPSSSHPPPPVLKPSDFSDMRPLSLLSFPPRGDGSAHFFARSESAHTDFSAEPALTPSSSCSGWDDANRARHSELPTPTMSAHGLDSEWPNSSSRVFSDAENEAEEGRTIIKGGMSAPMPLFEKQRQAALNSYRPARLGRGGAVEARVTFNSPASPVTRSLADELDAEEDQRAPIDSLSFASQRIVERATAMFDVRSVVISLIDEDVLRIIAAQGLDGVSVLRRQGSFESHVILNRNQGMVVPDTMADFRFADSPLAKAAGREIALPARFYAGMPILSSAGYPIGTVSLIDSRPRDAWRPHEQRLLTSLATELSEEMEKILERDYSVRAAKLRQSFATFGAGACQADSAVGSPGESSVALFGSPSSTSMGAGFGLSLADEVAREEIVQTMSPSCLAQKPSSLQYQHPRQSVLDLAVRTISNALELDLVYIAQLNPLGMGEDRRCSLVSHCGLDVSTASTVKLDPSSHLSALADSLVLQNVDVDRDEAAEGNVLPWWFHSGVNGRGEFFESGCMVPCRIGGENAEEYAHQWVLVALTSDPKRILHAFELDYLQQFAALLSPMLRPATVHRSSCISLSGSSLHSASAPPIERPRPKNAPRRLQLRTDIFDELEGTEAGRNSAVALGVALPYPEPPSLSVRPARTGGRDNVTNESALEVVSTSLEDEMPQTGFCLGGRFPHPPLSPGLLQSFPSSPNLAQSFLAPLRRLSTGRLDELVGANKANEVDAEQYDSAGRTFWTPSMDDLRDTPSPPPTCSSRLGRTRSFHSPLTRLRSSPVSLRALAAAGHTFRPSDGQYENSNSDSENFTGCIVPSTSTSSSISNPIIAAADMFPMPPTCEPEPPQPKLVRSPSFGDSLTRALRRSQIGLAHGQGGLTANGAERERDGKEIDGDEDEDGWRDVVRTRERTRRELEARRREVMDLVVIA